MRALLSLVIIIAVLVGVGRFAQAQQPAKVPRIGILANGTPTGNVNRAAFLKGLRELGYIEGKNIIIEYRSANRQSDLLPGLAAELVDLGVSVIVPSGPTAIRPAMKATKTIPIVMPNGGGNPVRRGFVKSLTWPGGNVTGISLINKGLGFKIMELLHEAFPWVSRVVVLNPVREPRMKEYKQGAAMLGLDFQSVRVHKPKDFEQAFSTVTELKPEALIVIRNTLTLHSAGQIAEFAIRRRLISTGNLHPLVRKGGLMAYGFDYLASWHRAATFVDKILKGANPADLPVEPARLKFMINLTTARKIGVTIPPEILLEANEVIK